MIIPLDQLDPKTLQNLVESFVSRSGTDYGESEASLDQKAAEVTQQLRRGTAVIVFDEELGSCNIVHKSAVPHDWFN